MPRPTAAQELKPRRHWYWVGALVLALGLGAGSLLLVLGTNTANPTPSFTAELDGAGSMTFEVGEGEEGQWALFTTDVNLWHCSHVTPSGEVGQLEREGSYETDDGMWYLAGILDTSEAGTHTYECSGESGIRTAVAGMDAVNGPESRRVTMVAFGLGTLAAGVVAALSIVVVTAVRRGAHKKRMAAGSR